MNEVKQDVEPQVEKGDEIVDNESNGNELQKSEYDLGFANWHRQKTIKEQEEKEKEEADKEE